MIHSPEYAAHEHGEPARLDRRGWRPILGELWSALALEGSPANAGELKRWGTHRVNALGELRESWRQLGARLVLVLRELDRQGPRAARCPRRRLAAEVIGGAAERVRRGRIGDPRRRFDRSARSARERVRGRLERACAALWATDVELAALGQTMPTEERQR